MDIKEQLKDIKTQLRLSMNGAVSQSMREKGLVYKLNFGVELPRIKGIAAGYEKDVYKRQGRFHCQSERIAGCDTWCGYSAAV